MPPKNKFRFNASSAFVLQWHKPKPHFKGYTNDSKGSLREGAVTEGD